MGSFKKCTVAAGVLAILAGCSTLPDRVDTLERARSAVRIVAQDDLASVAAAEELAAAREALAEADRAYAEHRSIELIEHKAYLAQRYAEISRERIAAARAKEQIARAEAERSEMLRRGRARQAEAAAAAGGDGLGLRFGDVSLDPGRAQASEQIP